MQAAMLIGTGIAALGQLSQGFAAKNLGDANAQIAMQDAERRRAAAKEEGYKLSRERPRMIGEQIAAFGAAGIDPSSGTALDVMARTAAEYERDIGFAGIRSRDEYARGENEASIYRWQGRQEMYGSWLKAGSTLLTGLGKWDMMRKGQYGGSF